jgi:hypothetical protein
MRSVMTTYGDGAKKIWMTEYGAPTGGPGLAADVGNYLIGSSPDHVTEALQEKMLREVLPLHASYDWAGPMFWYSYLDGGTSQSDRENFFGLIRYDGTQKPAYTTLMTLLAQ